MREDIKSLKICGGKFAEEASLAFWGNTTQANKKTPCALLYGRNGSGKSTIARAFRKIAGEKEESITNAVLCYENGNEIQLSDEEKKNIYVFDQKFIDENIRIEDDGLDTIVMLGSQVELDKKIKKLEDTIFAKKEELNQKENILNEFYDCKNPKAPAYYKNKIDNSLKGNSSWAERDNKISLTVKKHNTSVNPETYKQFIDLKPILSRDELVCLFKDKYNDLEKARNGEQKIECKVDTFIENVDIKGITELLSEKIEKPELSSRDKFLLEISRFNDADSLRDISKTFSDKNTKRCPYCARPITEKEKDDLVTGVENILNEMVKEHQKELDSILLPRVQFNYDIFLRLGNNVSSCMEKVEVYNALIDKLNELITRKKSNPYEPISNPISELEYSSVKKDLSIRLHKLEEERIAYNEKISDIDAIISKLKKYNNEIAYYDIIEDYKLYQKQKSEQEKIQQQYNSLNAERANMYKELEKLNAQKKSVNIAVNFINQGLSYIFFSNDRLRLHYADGAYQLLVNGNTVKPNQISTGETNAIALCYFFSKIGEGKPLEEVYRGNYLIVIDDPITSFDAENKVGMLSYLKSQVQEFILGNLGTKFLVMTHDMMTFTSIFRINEELSSVVKDKYANFAGTQLKNKSWILCDSKLEEYKNNEANEYSRLYNLIYDFAKGSLEASSLPIGNLMRQLMEAFSTFQYKIGIVELSTKENVIELLPNEYRNYFRNYMYRLVLNSGSHKENEAKFNLDMNFQSLYTLEEKKRTAKSILCFLYLLNKEHVLAHLHFKGDGCAAKNKQARLDLEAWCEEIKKMAE